MKNLFLNMIFAIYTIIGCIIKCFYGLNCIIINPVKMKTNYITKADCTINMSGTI